MPVFLHKQDGRESGQFPSMGINPGKCLYRTPDDEGWLPSVPDKISCPSLPAQTTGDIEHESLCFGGFKRLKGKPIIFTWWVGNKTRLAQKVFFGFTTMATLQKSRFPECFLRHLHPGGLWSKAGATFVNARSHHHHSATEDEALRTDLGRVLRQCSAVPSPPGGLHSAQASLEKPRKGGSRTLEGRAGRKLLSEQPLWCGAGTALYQVLLPVALFLDRAKMGSTGSSTSALWVPLQWDQLLPWNQNGWGPCPVSVRWGGVSPFGNSGMTLNLYFPE